MSKEIKQKDLKYFNPKSLTDQLNNIDPQSIKRLMDHVGEETTRYGAEVFERAINDAGLVSMLQTWGILDKVKNPNPYHQVDQLPQHTNWWMTHPTQRDEFDYDYDIYQRQVLALLAGYILGQSLK